MSEMLIFSSSNSVSDISYDFWSGGCNNIASPSYMQHNIMWEMSIFPSPNSVPDISYDFWSGQCNNIASPTHMQHHIMWEMTIFPSPNSVPAICKIFEVVDVITLPDSPFFIWMHCHIIWTMSIFPSPNLVPDISYVFWSGQCNNIASPSHMQHHMIHHVRNFHISISKFSAQYFLWFLEWAM